MAVETQEEIDKKYAEFEERIQEGRRRVDGYHDAYVAAEDQLTHIYKERDAWEDTLV